MSTSNGSMSQLSSIKAKTRRFSGFYVEAIELDVCQTIVNSFDPPNSGSEAYVEQYNNWHNGVAP